MKNLLYTFVHLSKIIRFYKDYFLLTDKMAAVFATERTNNEVQFSDNL